MKQFTGILLLILLACNFTAQGQSLNISINNSPTQLIQNGFVGAGVTVSNISGSLGQDASATFTNNGITNFPFSDGLLMTNGTVMNMNSPSSYFLSSNLNMAGEPVLDAIVAPQVTFDAQVLNFDFAAAGDSIEFDFIFSSEEYNDYVNTPFNDVFGFFITGPGYSPNTNVALIPGTTTPIAINSVNNGGPFAGASTGPCTNCNYYIDNLGTTPYYPLAPDGFTSAINIRFAVQPCATYSFKIAIADVNDGIFDSQVFLKQGSFIPCSNPRISAGGSLVINPAPINVCAGGSIVLSLPDAPQYLWSTGDTTQSIIVTQPGIYSAALTNNGSCFSNLPPVEVVFSNPVPPATITFSNDTIFSNYNTNGYTFSWTLNGLPVAGNQNFIPLNGPGCYQLTVYDSLGCSAESNQYCTTTGIDDIDLINSSVFPNPVTDVAYVNTEFKQGTTTTVEVFNVLGNLMQVQNLPGSEQTTIDVKNIADGIYYIEITNSASANKLKAKMIVNH